jgi:hypothetical protein
MALTDFFNGGKGAGAATAGGAAAATGGATASAGAATDGSAAAPTEIKPPERPAAAVYRYRCFEACTFQKRYRKEGDIIELSEKRDIPHFKPIKPVI